MSDIYGQVPRALDSIGNTIQNITKDITSEKTREGLFRLQQIEAEKDILKTKVDYALQDYRLSNDKKHMDTIEKHNDQMVSLETEKLRVLKAKEIPIKLKVAIQQRVDAREWTQKQADDYTAGFNEEDLNRIVPSGDFYKSLDEMRKTNATLKQLEIEGKMKEKAHEATMENLGLEKKKLEAGTKQAERVFQTHMKVLGVELEKIKAGEGAMDTKSETAKVNKLLDIYKAIALSDGEPTATKSFTDKGVDVNALFKGKLNITDQAVPADLKKKPVVAPPKKKDWRDF